MLDLFIIKAGQSNSDVEKTLESFSGSLFNCFIVDSVEEINGIKKISDWYGVFYDNEIITDKLLVALPVFFSESHADVLTAYRTDDENLNISSIMPRFFRKEIVLRDDCVNAIGDSLVYEKILNGWILNNV